MLNNDDIYVISDLHIFHDNIIKFCNRPCTKENHTQWIINLINSNIPKNAKIYHLGDLAFLKYKKLPELIKVFEQLHGDWYFIKGNHDDENQLKELCRQTGHTYLGNYHEFKYLDKTFVLFHYPIESWNKQYHGSIHLYGHVHNNPTKIDIPNRYNVCLDNGFKVHSILDIYENSL